MLRPDGAVLARTGSAGFTDFKIDKSFVEDIGRDPNADAICNAIIGLGHSLGKRVMAEGVETEGQLAFLKAMGCEEIQGYIFGRPEPAMEFAQKLARCD